MAKPSITFRGLALDHTKFGWRDLEGWEETPPLDDANVPKPTAHGVWAGEQWAQARTITVDGISIRAGRAAIGAAVAELDRATAPGWGESPFVVDLDERGPLMCFARPTRRKVPVGRLYASGTVPEAVAQWEATDPIRYALRARQGPKPNQVPGDPDMILDTGKWVCTNGPQVGRVTHDPLMVRNGIPSARVTALTADLTKTLNVEHPDRIAIGAEKRWRLSAWVRHEHPDNRAMRFALRCYDKNGARTVVYGPVLTVVPGAWAYMFGEVTVPATTTTMTVGIEGRAGWPAAGLGWWWSQVTAVPMENAAPPLIPDPGFDKDTGTWTPVDNASAIVEHDTSQGAPPSPDKCLVVRANADVPKQDESSNWWISSGKPWKCDRDRSYTATAYVWGPNRSGMRFGIEFRWKDKQGVERSAATSWLTPGLSWAQITSKPWAPPADAVEMWVRVMETTGFVKGETWYLDEVYVKLDSDGGAATVTNGGTAPVAPLVEFYGPMAAPQLFHTASGRSLGYNMSLSAGESLTVDCARGTVVDSSGMDRSELAMQDSTPEEAFVLDPGPNRFTWPSTGHPAADAVSIRWRDGSW
ncbi:hypothetical protein ACN20G_28145 (plasmid) [Streptomyces sp. BI20]|uniref:hypothetical protein n=1 Tax=Streptomyces sp. BI20 TaxID=3403460 RepID=UPI003C761381